MLPLWLVKFAVTKIKDENAEVMSFEEFIEETMGGGLKQIAKPAKAAKRTAEDIMAEFMPLVGLDQKKGG